MKLLSVFLKIFANKTVCYFMQFCLPSDPLYCKMWQNYHLSFTSEYKNDRISLFILVWNEQMMVLLHWELICILKTVFLNDVVSLCLLRLPLNYQILNYFCFFREMLWCLCINWITCDHTFFAQFISQRGPGQPDLVFGNSVSREVGIQWFFKSFLD